MLIVAALGGNALLRRGEPMSADLMQANVRIAAAALAPIARQHQLILTHGNGPQIGLLALQAAAWTAVEPYPLDLLGAQTEGMIGYLLCRELSNLLGDTPVVGMLTQTLVSSRDPAFESPNKFIGPTYDQASAERIGKQTGFTFKPDGRQWRRVVASPEPQKIVELAAIRLLSASGAVVVCAGGGGVPVTTAPDGSRIGVEAVLDKDLASSRLACELNADVLLLLTDVDGIYRSWGEPDASRIECISAQDLAELTLPEGSMAPKAKAACGFIRNNGTLAVIGAMTDASALLHGNAGTRVVKPA